MTDIKGVKGLALCANDCWNMYPIAEKNNGVDACPECRGEDRQIERIERDGATNYEAKVFQPKD